MMKGGRRRGEEEAGEDREISRGRVKRAGGGTFTYLRADWNQKPHGRFLKAFKVCRIQIRVLLKNIFRIQSEL